MSGLDVLLSGVVGSTAYGLAREGSDIDRHGFFVAPTLQVAGLDWNPQRETRVTTGPDSTFHEVGKACRLMLKGNPSVMEMLWLEAYETLTPLGQLLIDHRAVFLSERAIRAAYGGYAHAQAQKLALRGDGTFGGVGHGRTAKHGRHLLRLMRQGRELLATGALTVRVPDPADYWAFDTMSTEQMLDVYHREAELFDVTSSVLPAEPDRALVSDLLDTIRRAHL